MVQFSTVIKKFAQQGEKTGWTYIEISAAIAEKIKPNNKKSFRVKGYLDEYAFNGLALIPMGEGNFLMALNAAIRKKIRKQKGATLEVKIEEDKSPAKLNEELMQCLADEPESFDFFKTLPQGHQRYFSNWINSGKTDATKTKRIAQAITALANHQDYGQMIRALSFNKSNML